MNLKKTREINCKLKIIKLGISDSIYFEKSS